MFAIGCRTTATDAAVASRLQTLFDDLHERQLFSGAAVVGHGDRIVWESGFGDADAERNVRFTPDTPTDGASLAKTFTAALLITLEREGVLSLDAPVQSLLPELPYADITLRHLLSHSSGLAVDYGYFDAFIPADHVRTTEGLLHVLAEQKPPLAFQPGTGFEYSSLGYDLASLAAGRAAKMPYVRLLQERIFQPLGMTSAFARPARLRDFPGVRTLAYRGTELHDVFDWEAFHGGSNVYISARDLHRWNASFFNNDVAPLQSFARIGGQRSRLTLGNWYRTMNGSAYWYSGHLQGFHNEVFRDMRGKWSFVYVSNNTIEPWLQKGLVRAMRRAIAGDVPRLQAPAIEDVPKEERTALAGRWVIGHHVVEIMNNGGRLSVREGGVNYPMFPEGGLRAFYVPGLDWIVGFARGEDRSFSRIYLSSNIDERWGRRAH